MRTNLADELALDLRRMIADGVLSPGERINEVRLARDLGVSRTPLREALTRLATDGFAEVRPRRGFFVQPLDVDSARELYQMRAILDPAALELSGLPAAVRLDRLRSINGSIEDAAGDVERVIDLDDAWHLELVGACGNAMLLTLIRVFMQRTRPLERAYVRRHGSIDRMVAEHDAIIRHLAAAELQHAVAELRQNMQSGLQPILAWLLTSPPDQEEMRR